MTNETTVIVYFTFEGRDLDKSIENLKILLKDKLFEDLAKNVGVCGWEIDVPGSMDSFEDEEND